MLVAFTTLQTRLFFPVGSLLGVGLDVQTSLALFDRIFEYLDQPVDIVEKPDALDARSSRATSSSTTSGSGTATRTGRSRTSRFTVAAGRRPRSSARPARARRRSPIWPRASTTSTAARSRSAASTSATCRSRRCPTSSASSRRRPTSSTPRSRENLRLREAGRDRRGARGGRRGGAHPRRDRLAARGLRHGRRRARLPLLGRREAADRDRADDPAQPADPRPRRGDVVARHRDRAARAGGARRPLRGADDDRDRAPALDRPRRRPDRRARPRARRRDRPARGAARRAAGGTRCSSAATPSSRPGRRLPSYVAARADRRETDSGIEVKPVYTADDAPRRARAARRVPVHARAVPRRCTAAGRGRSASTPASRRRRRRTRASATCSSAGRPASRSRSTCRRSSGYDSDDPRAAGEVGRTGVAIDSLADMEILLRRDPARRGVDLDDDQRARLAAAPAVRARRARSRACRRPRCAAPCRTTSSRSTSRAGTTSSRRGRRCG